MKKAIDNLVKAGVLNFDDSAGFYSHRHGGLFYSGDMVVQEDITGIAKKLGMQIPQLYDQLITLALEQQTNKQKQFNRAELFAKMAEGLKGFESYPSNDADLKFIMALIKVIDDNRILVSTNSYKSWIMPASDSLERLTRKDMETVFANFLAAANHYPFQKTPLDILNRFSGVITVH